MGAAAVALAACDSGGSIESTGVVAPITVNPGSGGQNPSVGADGVVDFTTTGCPAGAPEGTITSGGVDITACIIPTTDVLTSDLTLTAGNAYGISGTLFVGDNLIDDAAGATATLTVEPGVVVFGASGEDAIVINPGSQIDARGTRFDPIVFTSASDLADADQDGTDRSAMAAASDGLVNGSASARGEWGGIVINGRAPINDCEAAVLGTVDCIKQGEGGSGSFGGLDATENSGTMEYVRIQYPGFLFNAEDELNGLALQAVGSGTTLSYIHIHNSADDAIEFFGGSVDADHIVTTGAGDDSVDWTDGWNGSIQFGVVVQTETLSSDPRGFEGDSNGEFPNRDPRSNPILANFTLVSSGIDTGDDGIKIRRGTDGIYANIIVSNFDGNSVDYDKGEPPATPSAVDPQLFSIYVAGSDATAVDSDATPLFDAAGNNNVRGSATLSSVFSINETRAVQAYDLADDDEDQPRLPDDNIVEVAYIGAFEESVQNYEDSWLFDWALEIPQFSGQTIANQCPAGTFVSTNTNASQVDSSRVSGQVNNVCTLPRVIEGDLFLPAGNVYELNGSVFVGDDAGADPANPIAGADTATLTIAPGVTLFGLNGEDALVVSRGSRIVVNGTSSSPVVMTSRQDVTGGSVASGQWGGLVINGRAPINDCEAAVLGTVDCQKDGEGGSGLFGGQTADDDSGILNYLRVQYAGFLFGSNDELNGIAFQGVGSGTEVDYIQVHENKDDGIEFFGGTVNVSHAIVTSAGDDAFDWTDGWTGSAQYVILVHEPGESTDPRVIEADNNGDFPNREPRSNPTIANLTLIDRSGSGDPEDGAKLRRGTGGDFYNAILKGDDNGDGIDFDDSTPSATVTPTFFSSYVADFATNVAAPASIFSAANGNEDAAAEDCNFTLATGATEALVRCPTADSVTPATLPAGLDAAGSGFIGAVEDASDTWYLGWTIAL